jgi:hypothetical protein
MANENLSEMTGITGNIGLGGKVDAATSGTAITAAKFRSLIDVLDVYLQHSHTFSDEYRSNCQCQCGRGSI